MKKGAFLLLFSVVLFTGCQPKIERFEESFTEFKSQPALKENLEKLIAYHNYEVDKDATSSGDKNIALKLEEDNYNALMVDQYYLKQLAADTLAPEPFSFFPKNNIDFLQSVVGGTEEEVPVLTTIRSEGFGFDSFSPEMMAFERFKAFCAHLNELEYLILHSTTGITHPELAYDGFYEGAYSGVVTVFDYKAGKKLGSFPYYATNSDLVTAGADSEGDYNKLYMDLNDQVIIAIHQGLAEHFSVSDALFMTYLDDYVLIE